MKPELSADRAVELLTDFNVQATLSEGHVRLACTMVSQSGARWEGGEADAPDEVLDATALLAHYLADGEKPGRTAESVMQASVQYAEARKHPSYLAAERLLMEHGGELTARLY